jgi:AcrR family transcriptional regulator
MGHHTIIQESPARMAGGPTSSASGLSRAVVSTWTSERTSATVVNQIPQPTVKVDGRKRRWHQHKVERRTELVDGALEAIRRRGRYVSMDEIAAEIGVSKTVLYRYFVDKNDLTTAVMMRFAQTTLIPNMAAALSSNLDGFDLTREIIRVYVETVAAEPEPYRFVMANSSASKSKVIADSERIIAGMLAVMLRRRMQEAGMDTGGVQPWAYMIVAGVQLATHSWMSNPRMSSDELIDYLTMLCWNALCGIVEVNGSLEKFNAQPHPSPILPHQREPAD